MWLKILSLTKQSALGDFLWLLAWLSILTLCLVTKGISLYKTFFCFLEKTPTLLNKAICCCCCCCCFFPKSPRNISVIQVPLMFSGSRERIDSRPQEKVNRGPSIKFYFPISENHGISISNTYDIISDIYLSKTNILLIEKIVIQEWV